jgi:hypothetical protein
MDGYLLSLQVFRFCLSGTGLFCDLFTSEHPSPMYRGENPQGALWRSSLQTRTVARVGSPNANVSMATPRPVRRIADDPGAPNVAGYDALQISPKTGQPHGGDPSAQGRYLRGVVFGWVWLGCVSPRDSILGLTDCFAALRLRAAIVATAYRFGGGQGPFEVPTSGGPDLFRFSTVRLY